MAKKNETKIEDLEINEKQVKEDDVQEEVVQEVKENIEDISESTTTEEIIESEINNETEEEIEETRKPYKTEHKFAMGDRVWVCDFSNKRGNGKFSQVVNEYQFNPKEGEIERVIITDRIQYKLKNKSGSLYDEEDVCYTEKQAMKLCDKKNRRE